MKTFIFIEKNGSAVITLSAESYVEVEKELRDLLNYSQSDDFRCDNEEGKDEN